MKKCNHSVTINGVEYPIAYNLAAIAAMEEAFGGLNEALQATGVESAIKIFECLAKGAEEAYWDPDVPFPALPSPGAYRALLAGEYLRLKDSCAKCIAEDAAVTVEAELPEETPKQKKRKPSGR